MISAEKALQIILDNTCILESKTVPILDSLDMVLADDIVAGEDYPPFDKAVIEGFAARSSDIAGSDRGSPTTLILDGDIKVGEQWDQVVKPGHAIKIAAGALLPEGADTVVPVDFAVRESAKKVLIYKSEKPGEHIDIKGDDIENGSMVFSRGRVITAPDIGLMAAIGVNRVVCHRKPRVAFFASGNELISPDSPLRAGKVRAGASYTLQIQLSRYGAEPVNLGILEMNPDQIKQCIEKAPVCDMMIVTSGSSGADFDYLKTILQKYGLDLKFWRVAIRPGKPFVFGAFNSMPVFGFSDNIAASMVILEQFVRPSLMKMQGRCEVRRTEVVARLERDIKGGNGMTHFIGAEVRVTDDGFVAIPQNHRSGLSVKAFYVANGFIVLPPEVLGVSAGENVRVQIIADPTSLN